MKLFSKSYLEIGKVGLFEVLIAMYPIIAGYAYGMIHLNDIMLFILCIMAYRKTHLLRQYKHLKILAILIVLHEAFLWFYLPDKPLYMLNNTLSILLCILSISIIVPAIDFKKYIHSIVLISIICTIGLVYHFLLVKTGHTVTPIKLPFLPDLPKTSRLYEVGDRPVSFFWEPASYANYMLIPMMYFLIRRKFLIVAAIMLALFLSTSSTGVMLSLIMLFLYSVLGKNTKIWLRVFLFIFLLVMIYVLLNTDIFSASVNKIQNTDIETTSRLFNGPELFRIMPFSYFITGVPYANITDYFFQSAEGHMSFLMVKEDSVFIPTFYLIIAKYGIGVFLVYLYSYIKPLYRNRELLSYVSVLFIAFFFASTALGSNYAYQMIFIYAYIKNKSLKDGYKS